MKTLQQLKEEVLADGVISEVEAGELDAVLFADGKISGDEAEFLFDLNDAVSGAANHPAWEALFIKGISSHVLDDESSEGEIDGTEAAWLCYKIKGDGQIDPLERKLLLFLQERSVSFPDELASLLE